MPAGNLTVIKSSGQEEQYSQTKLSNYLSQIQLPPHAIQQILSYADTHFKNHFTTNQITAHVAKVIRSMDKGMLYAARYTLKQDMRRLGPTGHAFEKFVGRLLQAEGAETEVGIILQGQCVSHEVDVVAKWTGHTDIVECKFHNHEGTRSDVVVAMYVYARYLDLIPIHQKPGTTTSIWLATNTKLTSQALEYAACKNMQILTIEQPNGNSILSKVITHNLFPITSTNALNNHLTKLFDMGLVMLSDVLTITPELARQLGIKQADLNKAREDALQILT